MINKRILWPGGRFIWRYRTPPIKIEKEFRHLISSMSSVLFGSVTFNETESSTFYGGKKWHSLYTIIKLRRRKMHALYSGTCTPIFWRGKIQMCYVNVCILFWKKHNENHPTQPTTPILKIQKSNILRYPYIQ